MQSPRIFPASNGGQGTIRVPPPPLKQTLGLLIRCPKPQQPGSGLTPSQLVACSLRFPHSWEVNILKHTSQCKPFFPLLGCPGAFPRLPDKRPSSQAALSCRLRLCHLPPLPSQVTLVPNCLGPTVGPACLLRLFSRLKCPSCLELGFRPGADVISLGKPFFVLISNKRPVCVSLLLNWNH